MNKFIFLAIFFIGFVSEKAYAQNFDVLLSEYSTSFAYKGKNDSRRATNIDLASKHFDKLIVNPGQLVSYNELVGPRTQKNGYQMAHVIMRGQLIDDWGGGACQVSGTLHAALLFAGGFDFVERTHHTRKSTYLDLGLDATVAWPDKDLKFKNIFPFPIKIVREYSTDPDNSNKKLLTFKIFGQQKLYSVSIERKILFHAKADVFSYPSDNPKHIHTVNIDGGSDAYFLEFYVKRQNIATNIIESFTEKISYKKAQKIVRLPYKKQGKSN